MAALCLAAPKATPQTPSKSKSTVTTVQVPLGGQEAPAEDAALRQAEEVLRAQVRAVEALIRELDQAKSRPETAGRSQTAEEQIRKSYVAQIAALNASAEDLAQFRARASRLSMLRERGFLAPADVALSIPNEVYRLRGEIFSSLDRIVSVELREATVRDTAAALTQASGISIKVDENVRTENRLTVLSQGFKLRVILQEIARQTGLLIAPDDAAKGVILRPMPSLEVNGKTARASVPHAPWSSEWGTLPSIAQMSLLAAQGYAGPQMNAPVPALAEPPPQNLVNARALSEQLVIAGLGSDSFVVAHPVPSGGPGFVLTVYRLEGGQFRTVGSTVHRIEGTSSRAPARPRR
jgi:hypothetical protein